MTKKLLQVGLQWENYLPAHMLPQRLHDRGEACASNGCGRTISESYIHGEAEIHVHLGAGHIGEASTPEQLCLALKYPREGDFKVLGLPMRGAHPVLQGQVGVLSDKRQASVLIEVGEPLENREEVVLPVLPTVVRLHSLDECPWLWRDVRNDAAASLREQLFGSAYREVGSLLRSVRQRRSESPLAQVESDVIEARPKVVERVPEDEGELGRWLAEWFGIDDGEASLRLTLLGDSIGVRSRPSLDFGMQAVHVLVCPRELERVVGNEPQGADND